MYLLRINLGAPKIDQGLHLIGDALESANVPQKSGVWNKTTCGGNTAPTYCWFWWIQKLVLKLKPFLEPPDKMFGMSGPEVPAGSTYGC